MNCFEEQERARSKTRQLAVLFGLALLAMEAGLNGALYLAWTWTARKAAPMGAARELAMDPRGAPLWAYLLVTGSSLAVVLGCAWWRSRALREGGGAEVARMAGGEPADAADPLERRLGNVVQEMSLASGTPMPQVFVMRSEGGINAFAAGWSPEDAAVCVTRGCLEALTRDELQGVIAHEFSHIHNADMRINIRAMGLLYGLYALSIVGRELLDLARVGSWSSSSRSADDDEGLGGKLALVALAVGVGFLAMGLLGRALGLAISAAISRQREFLADASAVQFTRNPDGIGGALRKIGGLGSGGAVGSAIAEPKALAMAHMFLGAASLKLADGMLATHPPLDERIEKVYGRKMGYLALPRRQAEQPTGQSAQGSEDAGPAPQSAFAPAAARGFSGAGRIDPAAALRFAGTPEAQAIAHSEERLESAPPSGGARGLGVGPSPAALPASARCAAASLNGARALCMGLMAAAQDEGPLRARAVAMSIELLGEAERARVEELAADLSACDPSWRVAMLDLASGSLRSVPAPERQALLAAMSRVAKLDGKVSLREQALFHVAKRRMEPPRGEPGKGKLAEAAPRAGAVLAWVARLGGGQARGRFEQAVGGLPSGVDAMKAWDAAGEAAPQWAELDALAPMQKPALAKAVAIAAGDSADGRDAARIACALIGCPAPYAEPFA